MDAAPDCWELQRTFPFESLLPNRDCFINADYCNRMTVGEKIEQFFTSRPNSYVPGHTLERLLSFPTRPDEERFGLNMAMHYGQGAVARIIRAIMSANGIRGPFADFMFVSVRLLIDQ